MNKPFDLEAFKKGHKALTRDGRVATFIGVCEECSELHQLIIHIERKKYTLALQESGTLFESALSAVDLVSMVSRHQALIDAYDPEDTWQFCKQTTYYGTDWETCTGTPEWNEDEQYRIHPHNDLIKAQRNGAIIEKWVEAHRPCWFTCYGEPDWDEKATYRVMPEEEKTAAFMRGYTKTLKVLNKSQSSTTKPKTKKVYEWMCKAGSGNWVIQPVLYTEEQAYEQKWIEYKKTGRSWEVEV